jgi:hypothetical protein
MFGAGIIIPIVSFCGFVACSNYAAVAVGLATAHLMRARIEQLFDLMAFYE